MSHRIRLPILLLLLCIACTPTRQATPPIRLATTTSTDDSGLLAALLPPFEQASGLRVEVIAVGTGQALALGERGDADLLLVHAPAREEAFIAAGHGTERIPLMFNDYVLVGPPTDPAAIASAGSAAAALARIASAAAPFASRGDESGTHSKELELWGAAGVSPPGGESWYRALGQGMGETLITAEQMGAYTLADRGTFLAMRDRLPGLALLVGGDTLAANPDPALRNPYHLIPVAPAPGINDQGAARLVAWLLAPDAQATISAFGQDRFGQPLFYPDAP